MNSKERIKQFIDFKELDYYPFEMKCGLSNGALKKATGVSTTSLEKIHKAFSELNMDWVVTGRGEMIYSDKPKQINMENDFILGETLNGRLDQKGYFAFKNAELAKIAECSIEKIVAIRNVNKRTYELEELDLIKKLNATYDLDMHEIIKKYAINVGLDYIWGSKIEWKEISPEEIEKAVDEILTNRSKKTGSDN